jgi:phytoene desaturase
MADDIDMRPCRPSTASASTTARCFDYTGDAAAMRAEVARFSPDDVDGYERFVGERGRSSASASSSWRTCPSARLDLDMLKIAPDMIEARELPHRVRAGVQAT